MAHGAGGRQTSELIDEVFKAHFANPDLTADDAAVLVPPAGKMAVSTDGFIVSPAFFPVKTWFLRYYRNSLNEIH